VSSYLKPSADYFAIHVLDN